MLNYVRLGTCLEGMADRVFLLLHIYQLFTPLVQQRTRTILSYGF